MAKSRFDVNTTIKLLETTKQFVGGLKTVDTDDSLGTFFLRDAENISLSEYGFIEKRYGLVDSLGIDTTGVSMTTDERVQGYFEYIRADGFTDQILFLGGRLYLKKAQDAQFTKVTSLHKKADVPYISNDLFNNYLDDFWGLSDTTLSSFDKLFDTGKDIEGVRIEEILYIFTGVYPIIYEGDGKFYLLPEFTPDFTELVLFSHNIHNSNNAEAYNERLFEVSDCEIVTDDTLDKTFEFLSETVYPRLPFTEKQGSIFNTEISYRIHEDILPLVPFAGFLQENGFPAAPNNGGLLADIQPRVYYRPAGIGASELEWIEIPRTSLLYTPRTNSLPAAEVTTYGTYNEELAPPDFTLHPEGISYYEMDIKNPGLPILTTDPYKIGIVNMPVGTYDVRFDLVFRISGYDYIGSEISSNLSYKTNEIETISRVYRDITFTKEKLQDYTEIDPAGLWTCHKVLNHYGKLMAYGSEINPERVYVGHPTYNEFFPEFFTIDFETDDDQIIQQITPFMNILVVQSESYSWGLKGIDALVGAESPYQQFTISPLYGTIAPRSVRPVRNQLFFLSKEGIVSLQSLYAIDDQYNVKHIDQNIENIVPLDPDAVAIQFDNQYWLHFPNTTPKQTFRYYIDNKSWVKDTHFELNGLDQDGVPQASSITFNGFFGFRRKAGDLYLITHPLKKAVGNFNVYQLLIDESIPTDLGEAPKTLFETAYMNQGMPFHPKKYMEQRYDFTIQNEFNFAADGQVYNFDGVVINNNLATLQNINTLKKNHNYEIAFTHPGMTTSGTVVDEFGNPYPNIIEPQYTIESIVLFDKDGNVVGQETVPQSKAKKPTIFEIEVEYNTVSFYLINNDDDNANITYYVDNPANGGVFENIGTRNLSDRITIGNLTAGEHILYARSSTIDTLDSDFAIEDFTVSEFSGAPSFFGQPTVTEDTITVTWTDSNDPISTKFRISYRDNTDGTQYSPNVEINNDPQDPVDTYTITGLSPGHEYTVRLSSYDEVAEEWSPFNYVTVNTAFALDGVIVRQLRAFPNPGNEDQENTMQFIWYDLADETEYNIQYIARNNEFTENPYSGTYIDDIAESTQQANLQFQTSDRNKVYKIRIRGYNSVNDGYGPWNTIDDTKYYEFLVGMTPNITTLPYTAATPVFLANAVDYIIFDYQDYPTANRYVFRVSPADNNQWSAPVTVTYSQAATANFSYKFAGLIPSTFYDIEMVVEYDLFVFDGTAGTGSNRTFRTQPVILEDVRTAIPVPGQTIAPEILLITKDRYSITWNILNKETDGLASIFGARGNTPSVNALGIVQAQEDLPQDLVETGLNPGTTYRFAASAKEDNETMSTTTLADITTLPEVAPDNTPVLQSFSGTLALFTNIATNNTDVVRVEIYESNSLSSNQLAIGIVQFANFAGGAGGYDFSAAQFETSTGATQATIDLTIYVRVVAVNFGHNTNPEDPLFPNFETASSLSQRVWKAS
jgi:hypothetical protein